ncbi:aryl-alcohol-oxidase from pleurotus Eryingii [Lactarius hatsudake]|nr:aryl-alcohol-oxidase from pleurotus Eryingii [Lactarius hatsudake]
MMRVAFLCTFGVILPLVARAALYDDPACLQKRQYDYIIVGAGAAGSVLASRLSASPDNVVLVIEAGPRWGLSPMGQCILTKRRIYASDAVDSKYPDTFSAGLNNRTIAYPRGKTLGGSTSINYMIWSRGPIDDYDRWARVTGDPGWSWESMQPIIKSIEKLVPPADGHDTTGQIDPSIHGTSGPVEISVQGFRADLDSRVLKAAARRAHDFPFNIDTNSGNPLGIGLNQFAVGGGRRTSAATAYLRPALSRPNLDVLISTQDTRNGVPVFQGVQFAQSAAGPVYTLNATNEVILSAGAVNTPQLLMLSGIGDNAQLCKFNIKTIVNSPMVGQNLQDHVLLPNVWSVNATFTYDDVGRNASIAQVYLAQWTCQQNWAICNVAKRGNWLESFASFVVKSPANWTLHDDCLEPHHSHFACISHSFSTAYDTGSDPRSIVGGTVTLDSASPWQAPLIDPALLNTKFDIVTIREAIKAARRLAASPGWDGYVIGPFGDFATAKTDAELEGVCAPECRDRLPPRGDGGDGSK